MALTLKQFKEWGAKGGKVGGVSRSKRKKEASKRNGAKGGRPKKIYEENKKSF